MDPTILRKSYLFAEHRAIPNLAYHFNIFDPETHQYLMTCREQRPTFWVLFSRFMLIRVAAFEIQVRDADGKPVFQLCRDYSWGFSRLKVLDSQGELVGSIRKKLLSIWPVFEVFDRSGHLVYEFRWKWGKWKLVFTDSQKVWATLSYKFQNTAPTKYRLGRTITGEITVDNEISGELRHLFLGGVLGYMVLTRY